MDMEAPAHMAVLIHAAQQTVTYWPLWAKGLHIKRQSLLRRKDARKRHRLGAFLQGVLGSQVLRVWSGREVTGYPVHLDLRTLHLVGRAMARAGPEQGFLT